MKLIENAKQNLQINALLKRLLIAVALGWFILTLIFIGDLGSWIFIPLLTSALGCIAGGLLYYFFVDLQNYSGWQRKVIQLLCFLFGFGLFWGSMIFGLSLVGLWD